jgi:chaperonin GroEL (HSP60 family)
LIQEVTIKTNDSAGDGRAIASFLGLIEELRRNSKPVKGWDDIKVVVAMSVGNDDFVRTMIVDALDKVGHDGVLSIESSSFLFETTVMVEEGMEINRGYEYNLQ